MNKMHFEYPCFYGTAEQRAGQLEAWLFKLTDLLNIRENTDGTKDSVNSDIFTSDNGTSVLTVGNLMLEYGILTTGFDEYVYENKQQTVSVVGTGGTAGSFANYQSMFKSPEILFPKAFMNTPKVFVSAEGFHKGETDFLIYDFFADNVKNDGFFIKSRIVSVGSIIGTIDFSGITLNWMAIGTKGA